MANESTEQKTEQTSQADTTSTQTKTGDTTQQATQKTTEQAAKQFTYTEDRSKWIPDTRFKEVNTGYQSEKTKRETLERDLATAQGRIQALAGVNPKAPEEAEAEEIKAAFAKMFPGLAKLDDKAIERLLSVAEHSDKLQETTSNYWRNHGRQMIGKASERIAEDLGGGELSATQQKRIAREYIAFIEETDGAIDRHEAGDEKLVEEFTKAFLGEWKDSIRRSVTTSEVSRNRPVPSGKGRTAVPAQRKKIDFNDPKAVEDAMVESYRDNGGTFTG